MYIYLLGFLLTGIFFYFAHKFYNLNNKNKTIYNSITLNSKYYKYYITFFILSLLPLGLISGLRYDVGTDYMYTYYPAFYKILDGNFHYSEFGFTLLNKIIGILTNNAIWLFIVTSFIFMYCLLKGIIKYTPNAIISVIVIFLSLIYFTSLNNVRQLVAVAICFLGFKEILRRRFLYYLFYILIAMQFHLTSILMIPVYFLINFKFIQKKFLFWMIVGAIIVCVTSPLFLLIISKTKYEYFFNSYFTNYEKTYINLLYSFVYLVLSYMLLYKSITRNKLNYALLVMQYFFFLLQLLSFFIPASEVILRLSQYFIIYQTILIPILVYTQKETTKNLWGALILLFYISTYFLYFYNFIIVKGYHEILPYRSIFN